jgi:hypothetical protein
MVGTSRRIDMEKFNGGNFNLWKLKMKDMIVDCDLWVFIFGTRPMVMKQED